jgi:glycosyltransferase involved in cell wall biosynthesis
VQRLKIAYITIVDPNDRHSWSGTNYYLLQTLRKHLGDVDTLGPAEPGFVSFVCKAVNFLSLKIFNKRFDYRHTKIYAKACSAIFEKKLHGKKYDLIVCPGNIASVAFLKTSVPIISIGDRTVVASLNYHKIFTDLWKSSEKQSLEIEKIALQNCALNLYPSQWAVDSVIKSYGVNNDKVAVLPFGANMDMYPTKEIILQKRKNNICNLLFIGVDWNAKGGPVAVECLSELIKTGIDSTLTVAGCKVPEEFKHQKIINYEFLNKNIPEQAKKLEELFLQSDIFILPTKIDAYGLVFCEASSYGIPSIGTNTGGVGGALQDGVNGYLMPEKASGKDYAEKIAGLFRNEELYLQMSKSSRELFEKKLNWDVFGEELKKLLSERKIV